MRHSLWGARLVPAMSLVTSEPSGEPSGGPPEPARNPPNVRLAAISVAVAIVVLGVLAFFSVRSESGKTDDNEGWAGTLLGQPLDKPEFTLTDTSGNPYDFRQQTRGYVTLLYFGYTSCPDVCPLHMANLAAVLQEVSGEVNSKIKVVFVTTDPNRDTPQVIRKWLDNFDVTFIGLTGTPADRGGRTGSTRSRGRARPPVGRRELQGRAHESGARVLAR